MINNIDRTSRSFFNDRFLTGRTRGSESKKVGKVWTQKVFHKLCMMPSKFIKYDSLLRTVMQWEEISRRLT